MYNSTTQCIVTYFLISRPQRSTLEINNILHSFQKLVLKMEKKLQLFSEVNHYRKQAQLRSEADRLGFLSSIDI